MEKVSQPSIKEDWISSLGSHSESALSASSPGKIAFEKLRTQDFPTTRQEQWKYTRTSRIQNEKWKISPENNIIDLSGFRIPGIKTKELVFINGFLRKDLSGVFLKEEIEVIDVAENLEMASALFPSEIPDDIFNSVNAAFCTSALIINIKADSKAEPLHFIFVQTGEKSIALPRIAVNVSKGVSAALITSYHSSTEGKCFSNAVIVANVSQNASLSWYKLQEENANSLSLIREFISQESDSKAKITTAIVDGAWVRNNLIFAVIGKNCESELSGTYMPDGQRFVDNHTVVDHRVAHCSSNELYKGVIFGSAKSVFNGKVFVRPDAQKTNAFQSNATILMSDQATHYSKPELEIYADDVKCSHGSTTGQMDEEAVFYLRSRGLGTEDARRLLVSAFVNDVLDRIDLPSFKEMVEQKFHDRGVLIR